MLSFWGERFFYPVFVFGRAGLLCWLALVYGPDFPPMLLAFTVASFLILIWAERWIPHRSDWAIRGDSQVRNDLGHSVAYVIFGSRLGEIVFLWGAIAWVGTAEARLWTGLWPDGWPLGLQIALVIFLGDGFEYGFHRLTHSVSWLWPLHVLHHTPDRLHTLKTFRHHWLYSVFRGLFVLLPVMALGAPLGLLPWIPIGFSTVGALVHANVELRLPRFTHRLLNTPDVHRIHHSIDPAHTNANYCFIFPLWDILFGTFVPPEHTSVDATGLREDPVPEGFLGQLLIPFTLRRASENRG